MVNEKDYLDNMDHAYNDDSYTSIFAGKVPHKVDVSLDVRMWLGMMVFNHCKKYGRKTCPAHAYSTGTNNISVALLTHDVVPYVDDATGQQHLRFTLNTQVDSKPEARTYSPTTVTSHGCDILGFIGIDNYVEKYAGRYINTQNYKPAISDKLVKKLEEALKAEMNGEVKIPVNVVSKDGRRKVTQIDGCGGNTKCPDGFVRIGNTQMCQRHFGFDKPNCSEYADDAVLHTETVGGMEVYWCEAPMVPVNSL